MEYYEGLVLGFIGVLFIGTEGGVAIAMGIWFLFAGLLAVLRK